MFRRAAINAALGSARSFYSHLGKWRKRKEKAQAKGKKFTERPPVPPRSWNKSATLYAGMWKERAGSSIMIKVWTGSVWSWVKVRITGREIPDGVEMGSPQLIRQGQSVVVAYSHRKAIQESWQNREANYDERQTKICSVDLNIERTSSGVHDPNC